MHNGRVAASCGRATQILASGEPEKPSIALHAIASRLKTLALRSPFPESSRFDRWWTVAMHSVRDLVKGNVLDWGAALAFYAVLSLFPLMLITLILLSFVTGPQGVSERAVEFLGEFLPGGEEQIGAIVDDAVAYRGRVGLASALTFAYTGRRVLGALVRGLNHVSDVDPEDDDARRRIAVEVTLFTGLVGLAGLAWASTILVNALWDVLWAIPGPDQLMFRVTKSAVRGIFLFVLFLLVFQAVPKGERRWRAAAIGALASTLVFLAAQWGFRLVLGDVWRNMTLAYGQLALAALLLTWAWIVSVITLAGGGLASHVKVMMIEDAGASRSHSMHVE